MTDLLAHALAGYVVATLATWWLALDSRYVPFGVVGAVVPDAAKVYYLTDGVRSTVFGVEIGWLALQTLGVSLAACGIVALAVSWRHRRAALGMLVGGVVVHVAMDYFVVRAGGVAPPYLYPLTWAQLPSVGLYLSSDVWPSAGALVAAGLVWELDRRRTDRSA